MTIPTPSAEPEDDAMVERMARIIDPWPFREDWPKDNNVTNWTREGDHRRDAARAKARAALSASGLLERERVLRTALEEIASSHYRKCPFDDPRFEIADRVPCPACGDVDYLHWPEAERAAHDKPSQCHQGGASSRAREALSNPLKAD